MQNKINNWIIVCNYPVEIENSRKKAPAEENRKALGRNGAEMVTESTSPSSTRESPDPGQLLFEMYHDLESAHAAWLRNCLVNLTVDTNRIRRRNIV